MGTYLLKGDMVVGVLCVTLRLSLRNGRYVGHLQWDRMRKAPTAWANIYGAWVLGMGHRILSRDSKKFTDTACPTRGPWFEKFVISYKVRIIFIKKHDFGVTGEMATDLLLVWDMY